MRLARSKRHRDRPQVQLSPLIDCVFLLGIFFLVTSMFKRWEMQIPISLPDSSSAIAENAVEDVEIIGLNALGQPFAGVVGERGRIKYTPIEDLAAYLGELSETLGPDYPVMLSVDRKTPFKLVIETLDLAQLQGLQNMSVRTRDRMR